MKAEIESIVCNWTDEIPNILVRLINAITLSANEEELRAAVKRIAEETELDKFFGIRFTDGAIQVHVLESVQEHLDEGVAMHHCVFDNAYYLKENSLILSATIEGRRIETIEVSLDTLKVVQSRGVCNKNTEYHEQIVSLVNANRKLIRQRMRATA